MLREGDREYYTTQINDVAQRLDRCVALGHTSDNAHYNVEHEIKQDIAELRAQLRTRDSEAPRTGFGAYLEWLDRLETLRHTTYLQWTRERRLM